MNRLTPEGKEKAVDYILTPGIRPITTIKYPAKFSSIELPQSNERHPEFLWESRRV